MAAQAIAQSEIDRLAAQGAAELRKERSEAAPRTVNLEELIALGAPPPPLLWDGVEYSVRLISWRDGLQIERAMLWMEQRREKPAATPEELEDDESELIQALTLMHTLLDPMPAENPFADASPEEVGALLGFFTLARILQRGRSRAGIGRAPTTSSTRSSSSPPHTLH